MAYELLLADADGTLFDFDAGEQNALTELFTHFDIPVREENFQTYHRINREQWALLEQGRTTLPELQVARMANFLAAVCLRRSPEEMHLYFRDRLSCQSILLPGAEAFCARVVEKMPICLVTNGVAAIQHARFDRCPISPYLSGLFISEELGAAKPRSRHRPRGAEPHGRRTRKRRDDRGQRGSGYPCSQRRRGVQHSVHQRPSRPGKPWSQCGRGQL